MKHFASFFSFLCIVTTVLWTSSCTFSVKIIEPTDKDGILQVRTLDAADDPAPPTEQDPCTNDQDCDGFSDNMEANGFTVYGGQKFFKRCDGGPREDCVDPDSRDLFIVLERASNSLIPTTLNPFEFVSNERSSGGLGIAVHEVPVEYLSSTRQVIDGSPQKALHIRENNTLSSFSPPECTGTPEGTVLGYTGDPVDGGRGLPVTGLVSYVRTKNIVGFIDHYCKGASSCIEAGNSSISGSTGECDIDGGVSESELDELDFRAFQHVLAHEVAHNLKLTYKPSNKYGWHHTPSDNYYLLMEDHPNVMEPTPGNFEFQFPGIFCSDCQKARRVYEY